MSDQISSIPKANYTGPLHATGNLIQNATIVSGGKDTIELKVARLRAALTQFVAVCDTAPPTSFMMELGIACDVARAALAKPK
jgi:hypothetical protein